MFFLAIALGLDKFLTLDNKNKFSLFSLNRNFALPFAMRKVGGASAMQENCFFLLLRSACTTFAVKEAINLAQWPSAAP